MTHETLNKSPESREILARRSTIGFSSGTPSVPKLQQLRDSRQSSSMRSLTAALESAASSEVESLNSIPSSHAQETNSDSVDSKATHPQATKSGTSPTKHMSAKFDLAMQLRADCERELNRAYEVKSQRQQARKAGATEPRELIDSEAVVRDKQALERLMRKLAPFTGTTAATHSELVHLIQSCAVCNSRVSFCTACAKKATDYFNGFAPSELEALYGVDLPLADPDELDAFDDAIAYREFRALHSRPSSRH